MANRTTVDAVEAIIDIDSGIGLAPFIEVANDLVTEKCSTVSTYSAAKLELIERWLAAHFYHIRDTRTRSKVVGDGEAIYKSKVDLGFNLTHYGQMAMRLDTNGELARLDNSMKGGGPTAVNIDWLGKTETEKLQS